MNPLDVRSPEERRSTDEPALVAGLEAGREWAAEAVIRRHGPRLLALARLVTGDDEHARESLCLAFRRAFRSAGYSGSGDFLVRWLDRLVIEAGVAQVRHAAASESTGLERLLPRFDAAGEHLQPVAPWAAPADELLCRPEVRGAVRRAIAELPAAHRVVLVLHDLEQMSLADIADLLGMTAKAVKLRLNHARQALVTLIGARLAAASVPQ
jgi:RNA polymerase sigma-70 factor (ECF subfamily)